MEDQIIENPDSTNAEVVAEPTLETEQAAEEGTATPTAEELIEQNKKLYARLKKAEEKLKASPKVEKPVAPKVEATDDIDSILTLQAEGRTPAEIKTLREYSRRMGKSIQEVAVDPVLKAGLEALRQQQKTQEAIPSPSKRAFTYKNKSLQDTILSGSAADAQAAIEQLAASRLRSKTND